jgi:hypothetical protein
MKPDNIARDEADPLQKDLRLSGRRKATSMAMEPRQVGASFFFEVRSGWEVQALSDDSGVRKVYTASGLEDAFHDKTVRTVLIPCDATLNRTVAMRVCRRHGDGKTVFYEIRDCDPAL